MPQRKPIKNIRQCEKNVHIWDMFSLGQQYLTIFNQNDPTGLSESEYIRL